MFAYYTSISYSSKYIEKLNETLRDFDFVKQWLEGNKLFFNVIKLKQSLEVLGLISNSLRVDPVFKRRKGLRINK